MAAIIVYCVFSLATSVSVLTLDAAGPEIKARPSTIFLAIIALGLLITFSVIRYMEMYK